jgi:hypothetical protein
MFATRSSSTLLTPARCSRAVHALYRSLVPRGGQVVSGGAGIPRLSIWLDSCDLYFRIRHARSRDGAVYFFADGEDVLLPGPGRRRARAIVRRFVDLLDGAVCAA